MDNTELIVLATCYSALAMTPPEALGKSLIRFSVDRGADVAVGWEDLAYAKKIKIFLKILIDTQSMKLADGTYPALDESLESAIVAAGEMGNIKIIVGPDIDPAKIFLNDLPRYGTK